MECTDLHRRLLAESFERVLGPSELGAVAFVRFLTPSLVAALMKEQVFALKAWQVLRVADKEDDDGRTVTADHAVEMREQKGNPLLLLVDTERAGAGLDGIYSAGRELNEGVFFHTAQQIAAREITQRRSGADRRFAELAIKKARVHRGRYAVSQWTEFDFLCRVAGAERSPGAHLHVLGLWPIREKEDFSASDNLNISRMFVDRLLGPTAVHLPVATRIGSLLLDERSETKTDALERFLHLVDTDPLLTALERLTEHEELWIGSLRTLPAQVVRGIELLPWRNQRGTITRWSGLVDGGGSYDPPVFVLQRNASESGRFSTLQVRWTADPHYLTKDAAEYRVTVETDQKEELAVREVSHSGRQIGERCRFADDDFPLLDEDAVVSARVAVEVSGRPDILRQVSEEFVIRIGEGIIPPPSGVGTRVRTFSEGLCELGARDAVTSIASSLSTFVTIDSRGSVLLRTPVEERRRKSYRVFRPSLIAEVERQWIENHCQIGRWIVKVRSSGARAERPTFHPSDSSDSEEWKRTALASRGLAERFRENSGVGQVYDETGSQFRIIQEYMRAWTSLLETGEPCLALANTVEVQSLSGRTIGIIVLPAHPLRVAWHTAYDNLVLHTSFVQGQSANDIRREFVGLDGAMFPAFLPNPNGGAFVFADTLGFHAVGMVPDSDREPKAAVAILARALGEGEIAGSAPTLGRQSANILSEEIIKYLDCHTTSHSLQIHALRAGDGFTVARSLGGVHERYSQDNYDLDEDSDVEDDKREPVYSLNLYSSDKQRSVAGRFISEAREKRRSGAGILAAEDRWMLESVSLPGGINMPRLRWARKEQQAPDTAAHLAIAFDSFESKVIIDQEKLENSSAPHHVFGLLSFFQRHYTSLVSPVWHSTTLPSSIGEKHPSARAHTDRICRLQKALELAVVRHLKSMSGHPVLKTEISNENIHRIEQLHRLCDWVVTLDRNAGIEYFDSPKENRAVYDAYVIDCVPEREDLGCLQLITSTANIEEVCNLLDYALDQMGLNRSRRNTEFILENLKALCGRLAIRLTGDRPPRPELVALALSYANCRDMPETNACWPSLQSGFIVPIDDIVRLFPQLFRTNLETDFTSLPNLIYVTTEHRRGLVFRFIEVRYRRHLRTANDPEILTQIDHQVRAFRGHWNEWYDCEDVCHSFRSVRRAKLARILKFYVDKASRYHLSSKRHLEIIAEINCMIEDGKNYTFHDSLCSDLGWMFCPEYTGRDPIKISSEESASQVFLFGPQLLPDALTGFSMSTWRRTYRQSEAHAEQSNKSDEIETPPADEPKRSGGTTTLAVPSEERPAPSVCLGTDMQTGVDIKWHLQVSGNPHLLIAGLPGMGKTTCLVNLCKGMAMSNVVPVIFSYHQDIDEKLREEIGDVRFVDFHDLGFNPLQVIDRSARLAHLDVAGAMRDIFTAIYPELGDVQADRIRNAIKHSFEEVGWTSTRRSMREPEFKRFLEILRTEAKPDRGLRTLLARLGELDDYGFFDIGDRSQGSLWDSRRPIVIRIHTTQNSNLQRAFASLVFYGLYKDMFRRGVKSRVTHALVFDEAHRSARLKLIPTMAKECRKYGISLVLALQEARDFDLSIYSAIANYLVLRSTDVDAKFLVRNVSRAQHERVLIDRIKQMDKFQGLYFGESTKQPSHIALSYSR